MLFFLFTFFFFSSFTHISLQIRPSSMAVSSRSSVFLVGFSNLAVHGHWGRRSQATTARSTLAAMARVDLRLSRLHKQVVLELLSPQQLELALCQPRDDQASQHPPAPSVASGRHARAAPPAQSSSSSSCRSHAACGH